MRPVATFYRRSETQYGVAGVAFRLAEGAYSRDHDVELGSIAKSLGTDIGGSPSTLMGLPGQSDDPDLSNRRESGVWAPDALAEPLAEALKHSGHDIVAE
jgi:hypothetical protein